MDNNSRIFIAGHRGLVGSGICRRLSSEGYTQLIVAPKSELDLRNQEQVNRFFEKNQIEYVFLAAAKVGGILANQTYMADFFYDNLMISANIIHASAQFGVKKLLNLGSSCIYPREATQPMREDALLSGKPEGTNEGYAIAKIAGLKMCQYYYRQYGKKFVSVMPTNLYGINDNFDPSGGHVIPALLRRFHESKVSGAESVTVWGSGKVYREFMYVDDLVDALMLVMQSYSSDDFLNLGYGSDLTIAELTQIIKEVVGFKGEVVFDTSKPDGPLRKLMNSEKARALGWTPKIALREGLERTYRWILQENIFSVPKTGNPFTRKESRNVNQETPANL